MIRLIQCFIVLICFLGIPTLAFAQAGMFGPQTPSQAPEKIKPPTPGVTYQQSTIRNKLDYPALTVVTFVDRCANSMMGYMPMHPSQSRPLAINLCSCLMDQFRSDFDIDVFMKGGTKLAQMMSPQYSEVCKQLIMTPSKPM